MTNAFWAWFTRTARVLPSRETSTRCPPATGRASRPASTETVPNRPVTTSLIATPTFVGTPSGDPVIDMRPPAAWTMKS